MADASNNEAVEFEQVHQSEIKCINRRRAAAQPPQPSVEAFVGFGPRQQEETDVAAVGSAERKPVLDTVGLALSGGGVRSAAFCLGALQALDLSGALKRIDYLSTVSGGGYIGSSLTAALCNNKGKFPFSSELGSDEPPSVQHIRDYSNYLIPHGFFDVLQSIAIYLRGLAANLLLILPWLLFAAGVTVLLNPSRGALTQPVITHYLPNLLGVHSFVVSAHLAVLLLLLMVLWALLKSTKRSAEAPEIPGLNTRIFASYVAALVVVLFCELQPFIIKGVFAYADEQKALAAKAAAAGPTGPMPAETVERTTVWSALVSWLKAAIVALTPLAAVVGFFSNKFGALIKYAEQSSGLTAIAIGFISKLTVYLAALAIPLILWAVYLQLAYWGISASEGCYAAPEWVLPPEGCYAAPEWIPKAAIYLFSGWPAPIALLYLVTWFVLFLASCLLGSNANSLHRLYRDRLSRAFLFIPTPKLQQPNQHIPTMNKVPLTAIEDKYGPYHLINTALNLQSSKVANRRGRNADFFLFSRNYIGSQTTGYVKTCTIEDKVPDIDLATAMATSGAAASSNMGSNTIHAWTASLAMLNVRLGYWMRNPRFVVGHSAFVEWWHWLFNPYFLYEMFGRLSEKRWFVYLTDGGHIENLGIYELLRRRCCLIIAVDAEADPNMTFNSFITLQRYARIDMGVRIELPWHEIRAATLTTGAAIASSGGPGALTTRPGPHCAIGKIYYSNGEEGRLLYVKSSLSGDENDYVVDYKRRYPQFPHETTGDQFFSEEQFEVYRALGFHAMQGVFSDRDHISLLGNRQLGTGGGSPPTHKPSEQPMVKEILDLLGARKTEALPTPAAPKIEMPNTS